MCAFTEIDSFQSIAFEIHSSMELNFVHWHFENISFFFSIFLLQTNSISFNRKINSGNPVYEKCSSKNFMCDNHMDRVQLRLLYFARCVISLLFTLSACYTHILLLTYTPTRWQLTKTQHAKLTIRKHLFSSQLSKTKLTCVFRSNVWRPQILKNYCRRQVATKFILIVF